MVRAAARVSDALVRRIVELDDGTLPIAEVARRAGTFAETRRETRPSYETVRTVVHLGRALRREPRPSELRSIWKASIRGGYAIAFDQVLDAVIAVTRRAGSAPGSSK